MPMRRPLEPPPSPSPPPRVMERAHVLVRLGDGAAPSQDLVGQVSAPQRPGISRTSAASVRLEHSDMSPGVASISFERVFDAQQPPAELFRESLAPAVDAAVGGRAATAVFAGAEGAGKSFLCHGDADCRVPGVATLAIRHVFRQLEGLKDSECQVLLTCVGVGDEGDVLDFTLAREGAQPSVIPPSNWRNSMASCLLECSVRVKSSEEGVHMYSQARRASGERDFVLALHIEMLADARVRQGRFVCIDIHGSSIMDPEGGKVVDPALPTSKRQTPCFDDTHFPINRPLSEAFGSFLGNDNATYVIVAIKKATQYQQQAIQSLLFACKAKDIRSICTISYLSGFTVATSSTSTTRNNSTSRSDIIHADKGHRSDSPVSSANQEQSGFPQTNSVAKADIRHRLALQIPPAPEIPSMNTVINTEVAEATLISNRLFSAPGSAPSSPTAISHVAALAQKRAAVSVRLRKAYEIAKAATASKSLASDENASVPPLTPRSNQDVYESDCSSDRVISSRTLALHHVADTILASSVRSPRSSEMSLLQKLELIRLKHDELERALAHELSVKEKCVDRISKLTQTMGVQVAEHEKNMANAIAAKQAAEVKTREMEAKFTSVAGEISSLQQQVAAMKMAAANAMSAASTLTSGAQEVSDLPSPPTTCNCKNEERAMVQGFAAKLEQAMQDAKGVVEFKNGIIRDLESRLRDAENRYRESNASFEREKTRLSSEHAVLRGTVDQLRMQLLAKDELIRDETFRTQQDQADLMVKMAQLTLDVETQRKQWIESEEALKANLLKMEAEGKQAALALKRVTEQLETLTICSDEVKRKYVALLAAHAAAEATIHRQEVQLSGQKHDIEIHSLVRKLTKRKAKLDRARGLLSDRKKLLALANARMEELTRQLSACEGKCEDYRRNIDDLKQELIAKGDQVDSLEALHRDDCAAIQSLDAKLRNCQEQLTRSHDDHRQTAESSLASALDDQKRELTHNFEQQVYELEQAYSRRLVVRETQLQKEHDDHVRELMERHSAEVLELQHSKKQVEAEDIAANGHESIASSRRRHRHHNDTVSLQRQLSSTQTASLSSSSSSSRSSSTSSPTPLPSPLKNGRPTTPRQQSIRDLDALIDAKERRYETKARQTPVKSRELVGQPSSSPSPAKSEGGGDAARHYKKALNRKQREVDELQMRTQQLLTALATANEEETLAKTRAEQIARAHAQDAAKLEELLQELNRVKNENWSLSLALHVTEKARTSS